MLPFLLVFFTFTVWPVVMSMGLSFTTYNVFEAPRFLGFENYVKLFFNDSVFLTAMQNTFLLSIIVGPLSYLLSLFLAWIPEPLAHHPDGGVLRAHPVQCGVYHLAHRL